MNERIKELRESLADVDRNSLYSSPLFAAQALMFMAETLERMEKLMVALLIKSDKRAEAAEAEVARYREALQAVLIQLGVPDISYPDVIAAAARIARQALKGAQL